MEMDLNLQDIQNEHHQDLLREADTMRLIHSLPKNHPDLVNLIRHAVGKKLISVGHHLIDSPHR